MKSTQQRTHPITIKDVAKLAGVSIATVSRIMNGTATVSTDLTEKVQSAIAQLGYSSNNVARALKAKESCSIGLIIPDIENPFFPTLVRSIEDTARSYGNSIMLCNSDGKAQEEKRYIEFLYSKRVDGLIFTGGVDCEASLALLESLPIPSVILDRRAMNKKMHSVLVDNYYGAQLAVEHLLKSGCEKIAFIGGVEQISVAQDRYQGYRDTLKKNHREFDARLVHLDEFTFESGYRGMQSLLEQKVSFDAVFAGNDIMAFGVIECLINHGLQVPADVLVVGYDDIWMAKWYKPSLTTICQPVYDIGKAAVDLLMQLRENPRLKVQEKIFKPELAIRNSTSR